MTVKSLKSWSPHLRRSNCCVLPALALCMHVFMFSSRHMHIFGKSRHWDHFFQLELAILLRIQFSTRCRTQRKQPPYPHTPIIPIPQAGLDAGALASGNHAFSTRPLECMMVTRKVFPAAPSFISASLRCSTRLPAAFTYHQLKDSGVAAACCFVRFAGGMVEPSRLSRNWLTTQCPTFFSVWSEERVRLSPRARLSSTDFFALRKAGAWCASMPVFLCRTTASAWTLSKTFKSSDARGSQSLETSPRRSCLSGAPGATLKRFSAAAAAKRRLSDFSMNWFTASTSTAIDNGALKTKRLHNHV